MFPPDRLPRETITLRGLVAELSSRRGQSVTLVAEDGRVFRYTRPRGKEGRVRLLAALRRQVLGLRLDFRCSCCGGCELVKVIEGA